MTDSADDLWITGTLAICRVCLERNEIVHGKDWSICIKCHHEGKFKVIRKPNGEIEYCGPSRMVNDRSTYYHQEELDTCGFCSGYDGCLLGCTCPHCIEQDKGYLVTG